MTFGVMGGGSGDGYTGYRSPGSVRMTNYSNTYRWQRTFSTTGNRTTWTYSMWLKRGTMSTSITVYERLLSTNFAGIGDEAFRFDGDRLMFYSAGGSNSFLRSYDRIYTTDGWYHIVLAVDTTQATAANRVKMYINNQQCTLGYSGGSIYPAQNYAGGVGAATFMQVGNNGSEGSDMTIAEVSMVDGQQLTPTAFGEYDASARWRPKQFTGTWGTNGYYLNWSDRSTANALGLDKSGNGQNFTMGGGTGVITGINNIISYDSPTPTSPTVANYARFTSRFVSMSTAPYDGGLTLTGGVTGIGNMGMSVGSWYWEVSALTAAATAGLAYNVETTRATTTTVSVPAGSTYGLRFNATAGTLDYTADGSAWTSLATGLTTTPYRVYVLAGPSATAHLNHGQRPFTYTPPAGYKNLNSYNLPSIVGDPAYGVTSKTFLGTGATQSITGFKFSPDVVWIQRAGVALYIFDKTFPSSTDYIQPSVTSAKANDGNSLTSFNSDGFTIGISSNINLLNGRVYTTGWKVSRAHGFDRVSYTGTGAITTINHNLGAVPGFIMIKRIDAVSNWICRFGSQPNTDYFIPTGATAPATDTTLWNSTTPTSSNITLGTNVDVNASGGSYKAYLFTEVLGYSKIGTYTGSGSSDNRTHVFCGFKPAFIILRRMDATASQTIMITDGDEGQYVTCYNMYFGGTTYSGTGYVHFTATGFAIDSSVTFNDTSGVTYAYMAYADAPPSHCLEGSI